MGSAEFLFLLSVIAGQFVIMPLVGASLLYLCSRNVGVPGEVTFAQSWKAYLVAVCCGLCLMICLNLVLPSGEMEAAALLAIQFSVTSLAHFAVILLRLRKFSHAALLAQGCVVMLTNLVAITLILSVASA